MTSERTRSRAAVAILAALPALVYADILLGLRVLHTRDVAVYHHPLRTILREIVTRGEFPYWNPWIAAGQPLAANPAHQIFYPFTWLILLPSFEYGFQLHALVHVFIATFGMFALLRSMSAGRTASVLAALSFGLGGLITSELNLFPFLLSTAWIPWICLFTRRALKSGSRRDFAFAALTFALQLLVAEPMTTVQTGILLGLYALFHGGGSRVRRVALIGALSLAATLLAAVQIVPALDHFRDTTRATGIPYAIVAKWSTPPVRIAEVLNPELLGHPDPESLDEYWGSGVYRGAFKPFFYSIYPGLLVAIGALAGLITRRRGWKLYAVSATLSLIAAIGAHTPLLRLLYDLGIASAIRYAEKFLILGLFASVVFAGMALDDVLRGDLRARRAARVSAGILLGVSLTVALLGYTPLWEGIFRQVWRVPPGFDLAARLEISQHTWMLSTLRALGVAGLMWLSSRVRPFVWQSLLVGFVFADLASLNARVAPRTSPAYYEMPASLRALPASRDAYRIYHLGDDVGRSPRIDPYFRPQADSPWILRSTLTPYLPASHGFRLALDNDFDLTSLRVTEDFRAALAHLSDVAPAKWLLPAVSMANAHYVVWYRDPRKAFAEANGNLRELRPVELRFVGAHPRYWFARELVTIRDARDFVRDVQTRAYRPGRAFIDAPSFVPAAARVTRVTETTQSAKIEVEAAGESFLVMSVTPHRYWRITLDGVETSAVLTNIGFQGIRVPAGTHVIEMQYVNPLIAAGGAISLASLLALVLFARSRPIDARVPPG